MEKNFRYSALLSVYGSLLTLRQKETMEYYYDEDLSLGEIAENMDISRQGVRDFIKRAEELLDDFESKLGLLQKAKQLEKIERAAGEIQSLNARYAAVERIDDLAKAIAQAVRDIYEN